MHSEAISDVKTGLDNPHPLFLQFDLGFFFDWSLTYTYSPFELSLTNTGAANDIMPGDTESLTIYTDPGAEVKGGVIVSTGAPGSPQKEITATLVPEPSSMVLATVGGLGFLGYRLRRRIAN